MVADGTEESAGEEVVEGGTPLARLHGVLSVINNFLLIPLFALMVLEASGHDATEMHSTVYVAFCVAFLLEWCVGLAAAESKWDFAKDPSNISDLVSSIPFGAFFQGFRLIRLLRLLRLLRLVWRTRRFRGRAAKIIKAVGLVSSLVLAAAIAFRTVEPETTTGFEQALWWAVVTLSTVGYGDVMPLTPTGHVVAMAVIFAGLGVFGYMAGVMSAILDDHETDPVRDDVAELKSQISELTELVRALSKESRDATGSPP